MKLLLSLKGVATATIVALAFSGCAIQEANRTQAEISKQANDAVDSTPKSRPIVRVHEGAWLLGEKIHASKVQPEIYDKTVLFRRGGTGASLSDITTFIAENVGVQAVVDPSAIDAVATSASSLPGTNGATRGPLPMPGSTSSTTHFPQVPGLGSVVNSVSTGVANPIATPGVNSAANFASQGARDSQPSALTGSPLKYYSGNFKGFLDVVNARYGVWSRYRDGVVTFYRLETRTYVLPTIADASAMNGTISTGNAGGNASSGSSMGAAPSTGGGANGSGSSNQSGGQSISLSVQSAPWASLQSTAQAIAGNGATVVADQNLNVLTVTGTPPQCDRVEEWVKSLNAMFGKQVAIDVNIYEIQNTRSDNLGLSLTAAYQGLNGHTGVSFAGAAAPTVTSSSTPMSFGATILGGTLKGSSAAVQALSTLGNLSQLFSRSGVTQNGKLLALQAAKQQGYVASTQSMQTASVGSSVTMQTATLVPGFTSSFLPKVVEGRILIDFDMTLSDLLGLQTFTAGSGENASSVQLPTMQVTRFEQSVSLKPGETLVLTGMREHSANSTANGVGHPYMPLLGGGFNAEKDDTVIAVVITARLL